MKPETVTRKHFHFREAPRVKRIWDQKNQKAVGWVDFKGLEQNIDDFNYILIHLEGWAIISTQEGLESCKKNWPNQWLRIVKRGDQ